MGSAAEGTTLPAKAPPPTTASKLHESEVSSLPAASPVVYSADWATAVHAYYSGAASGGIPPPFYAPPVWGSQMMSPYGTPMAYSPMYPVYTHSSVATQECEDLARKVNELSSENSALKVELEQLKKTCEDLEAENASITEDLNCMAKTGIRSQFEGINSNSLNPTVGEGNSTVPQNPRGSN